MAENNNSINILLTISRFIFVLVVIPKIQRYFFAYYFISSGEKKLIEIICFLQIKKLKYKEFEWFAQSFTANPYQNNKLFFVLGANYSE